MLTVTHAAGGYLSTSWTPSTGLISSRPPSTRRRQATPPSSMAGARCCCSTRRLRRSCPNTRWMSIPPVCNWSAGSEPAHHALSSALGLPVPCAACHIEHTTSRSSNAPARRMKLPKPRARPVSLESAAAAPAQGISLYRCQTLAYNLPGTMEAISRARPGDIPEELLDAYLRLGWLRWESGRLKLTAVGAGACAPAS